MFILTFRRRSHEVMHGSMAAALETSPQKPLSIAMMIESVNLGGAEMVVLQLTQALRERGHSVHPVVPMGRDGWLLDEFRKDRLDWLTYDLRRPIDGGFPRRLAAQLAVAAVDVVHSHEFVMAVYGAAATQLLRIPHVITMHGNQTMTQKFQRRVALRYAFKLSRHVIAVSGDTRNHLESSLGVRPGVVDVIRNGIPVRAGDRAGMRRALGVADSEILMLSVGNMSARKGHAVLLQAMAKLQREGFAAPWRLAIVGDGEERVRLEGIIRDENVGARVQLLGKRTDIHDLQAAADVFVLPSLWEGLPLALLEGMFGGNAIVASNISGIPEAVEHGEQGLLVPAGDVSALAAALSAVLSDAALRTRLATNALARAREEFTIDFMTSAYERLYRPGLPAHA